MASSVVFVSQSHEERTLTGTPSGSVTQEEGASGSLGVLWSEKISGSADISAAATATQSYSSDEGDSHDSTPRPPIGVPTPIADQPNRWCVDGKYQVYSDAKLLNDKGVMTRTLTLVRRVLTGSLPTMPDIHNIFTRHHLEWTAHSFGRYSKGLVRVFYAYVATLRSHIDRRDAPSK